MPTLDALAYYSAPVGNVNELWTRPFSKRVLGIPTDSGEWQLSAESESLDTRAEYQQADKLRLSLWDSQGEEYTLPETGQWSLILSWPRRAQKLRYRVSEALKIGSARQPHSFFDISFQGAAGAKTTADPGEPINVTLQSFSQYKIFGFWVRLLPISTSGALKVSETGEIDVSLKQRFLARFNPDFKPGFMFSFENRPYVVDTVSRQDRRRMATLLCNEIGGESG